MQAVQHTTNAAGRLTSAMCQYAIVFPPEFILVESPPNRVFLDMQDEFCGALFEQHDILLDDRRDAIPAGAHAGTVDRVATIYYCDRANHRARVFGVQVKLFSHGIE